MSNNLKNKQKWLRQSSNMMNSDLELTPQAEIRRLNAAIQQKNAEIRGKNQILANFKVYDDNRKEVMNQMRESYAELEERLEVFAEAAAGLYRLSKLVNEDAMKMVSEVSALSSAADYIVEPKAKEKAKKGINGIMEMATGLLKAVEQYTPSQFKEAE